MYYCSMLIRQLVKRYTFAFKSLGEGKKEKSSTELKGSRKPGPEPELAEVMKQRVTATASSAGAERVFLFFTLI